MRNFETEIKNLWGNYNNVSNESNDDAYFTQKYGELGINSRKAWFIWKTNISKLASPEEINEYSKKYQINL